MHDAIHIIYTAVVNFNSIYVCQLSISETDEVRYHERLTLVFRSVNTFNEMILTKFKQLSDQT